MDANERNNFGSIQHSSSSWILRSSSKSENCLKEILACFSESEVDGWMNIL